MGSSFQNILIECAPPDALGQSLVRELKPAGFVPAGEEERADCVFRVFGAKEDRFWVLVGDSFNADFPELAKRLARSLKRRAITAQCVDSDVLLLPLTNGGAFTTVCVGDPDAYDIQPGPYRAAPWKELVGEANWAAFRAAVEAEYVCADEALQPLAALIGFQYPDSVRYFDDPGEPLLEFPFKRKVAVPEYIPEDQPSAFRPSGFRMEQGALLPSFASAGGRGTGAVVYMVADGFDADALEIPDIRLVRAFYYFRERRDAEVKPERVRFRDGRTGWAAAFPDVEILPGANPEHPKAHSMEGLERESHREYFVIFSMRNGWSAKPGVGMSSEGLPALDIHLVPVQNRTGGAVWRVALDRLGEG